MADIVRISTHVLDSVLGRPAVGIPAVLEQLAPDGTTTQCESTSSPGLLSWPVPPSSISSENRNRTGSMRPVPAAVAPRTLTGEPPGGSPRVAATASSIVVTAQPVSTKNG